jgi:hypothetical protein
METRSHGAFHTPDSLKELTNGSYEDRQVRDLLLENKHGLRPVEAACLLAAAQDGKLDRILEAVNPDGEKAEGETQADRIEALLERLVSVMESLDRRVGANERLLSLIARERGRH